MIVVGKEWVTVANIFIPKEKVALDNYHTGQCVSSVLHHNGFFDIRYGILSLSHN